MFEQLYLVGVYQLRRWTLGVWQFRPSLTYRSKHFSRAAPSWRVVRLAALAPKHVCDRLLGPD